nr:MAG TPA: hypothetical protein [Caudoviricetes sp.]
MLIRLLVFNQKNNRTVVRQPYQWNKRKYEYSICKKIL